MALGDPGKEQFANAILTLRNQHIAAGLAPLMELRLEVVHSEDIASRAGLDTPSRDHFVGLLNNADRWRRRLTHNPDKKDLKTLLDESKDADGKLADAENPYAGDDIQMGATGLYTLPWDLSGADPDIPLTSHLNLSGKGRLLLLAVDTTIVAYTRLVSRHRQRFVTRFDSMRIYGLLRQLYAALVTFGGDENRVDVAQIPASEEPRGPENAPNRKTEQPGDTPVSR